MQPANDIRDSRFWKCVCFFTRSDLDVLAESNRFDRGTVSWTGIALVLAFVLHTALWSCVAGLLIQSRALQLLAGATIALMICTLEVSMAASDWSLAGILRQPGLDSHHYMRIGIRVFVAVILSYATSLAFAFWLHGPELAARDEAERRAKNAPLVEEARREKARLHAETVQPVERALAAKEAERAAALARAEQARHDARTASALAQNATIEMQREETGLERIAGRGPRYADAALRERLAQAQAASAAAREMEASQEAARLDRQADELKAELRRSSTELESRSAVIDGRIGHDERYVARRDSLLTRQIALEKLYRDPDTGAAARHLHWVVQVTLICLELILLMVKMVFAPTSVYTVRMIARARVEAARIDREAGRMLSELRGPRPGLRVVPRPDAVRESDAGNAGQARANDADSPERRRAPPEARD